MNYSENNKYNDYRTFGDLRKINGGNVIVKPDLPNDTKVDLSNPLDNNFMPVYIDRLDGPIKYHSVPHKRKNEVVIENPIKQIDLSKDQFTLDELLELDVTEIPFLVEKLIPKESITFIAGSSDVGKSLFYTQLALLLILDKKEFVGFKINSKYKRVILASTEDGAVAISSRIRKQLDGATVETSIRNLINCNGLH